MGRVAADASARMPREPPTGGGIAVAGDWDRHVYVYDAGTGDGLWQTRLPTSVHGYPGGRARICLYWPQCTRWSGRS